MVAASVVGAGDQVPGVEFIVDECGLGAEQRKALDAVMRPGSCQSLEDVEWHLL